MTQTTGCDPDGPRCRDATRYHKDTPECCREHQRQVMDHVAAIMAAAGVRWWMDYGTLLGAVRNPMLDMPPGIIPYDKDGDIGVFGADWDAILGVRPDIPWESKRSRTGKPNEVRIIDGFEWCHKLPRSKQLYAAGDSIKVRRSPDNHNNVDVFPWHRREDGTYYRTRYVGCDRYKGREFPEDRLLPLTELEWEGRTLPAPADPEWFCAHRYGDEWQTPLRKNNDRKKR